MDISTQRAPNALVFLVQEPSVPKHNGKKIDTTPLMEWGNVETLIEQSQYPSFRPLEALRQIQIRLKKAGFDPDRDYIAVAGGDSVGVLLTGAALANMGYEYAQYLRFERARLPDGKRDPSRGSYVPITVPLALNSENRQIVENVAT